MDNKFNSNKTKPKTKKGLFNFGTGNLFGPKNNTKSVKPDSVKKPLNFQSMPKVKKNNLIIGIVVFLVVAVGIGLAVYFLVIKPKQETSNNNANINDNSNILEPEIEQRQNEIIKQQEEQQEQEQQEQQQEQKQKKEQEQELEEEIIQNSLMSNQPSSNVENTSTNVEIPGSEVYVTNRNIWSYDDAEAVCKLQGGELASYEQLVEAAKDGANWCNLGWVKSDTSNPDDPYKFAHFPVQRQHFNEVKKSNNKDICGPIWNDKYQDEQYSIQGGAYNKNKLLAVNCYGPKRDPMIDEKYNMELIKESSYDPQLQNKMNQIKDEVEDLSLLPFNKDSQQWSQLNGN